MLKSLNIFMIEFPREMICGAARQYPIYNMETPTFPFILQPIAEEKIKKHGESNH